MMPTPKIDDLAKLKRADLREVWREHFNADPPPNLSKEIMVPLLAYRIQEREHGGLSQAARRRLKELGGRNEGKRRSGSAPHPGTRLVRSWKGELHEVTVAEQDFEYRGRRFATLSVIAREITGTRWSGPAFFGLREQANR